MSALGAGRNETDSSAATATWSNCCRRCASSRPTAYHRLLFRQGDKEFLVVVANRLTLAGLVCVGLSIIGAMVFVTDVLFPGWAVVLVGVLAANSCIALWAALPLARRRDLRRRAVLPRS